MCFPTWKALQGCVVTGQFSFRGLHLVYGGRFQDYVSAIRWSMQLGGERWFCGKAFVIYETHRL
jgi:hypothetical protein